MHGKYQVAAGKNDDFIKEYASKIFCLIFLGEFSAASLVQGI